MKTTLFVAFTAPIWKYDAGKGAWFFVTLSKKTTDQINEKKKKKPGWGQVKVKVTIGSSTWTTSIFPDRKLGYVLPIKKEIRQREDLHVGAKVRVQLRVSR